MRLAFRGMAGRIRRSRGAISIGLLLTVQLV